MPTIEIQITEDQLVLLQQATAVDERRLDEFIVQSAIQAARDELGSKAPEILEMTTRETYRTLAARRARLTMIEGEPLHLWSAKEGILNPPPEGGWLLHL